MNRRMMRALCDYVDRRIDDVVTVDIDSPKRRFRVRQDGWVRHDGGECPVPETSKIAVLYRCGISEQCDAKRVPQEWWTQTYTPAWDVMWFKPLSDWREREPAAWS